MKIIKVNEWFTIIGRGQVATAFQKDHDFDLTSLTDQMVLINNESFLVKGIESFGGRASSEDDLIGLIVKKIDNKCKHLNIIRYNEISENNWTYQLEKCLDCQNIKLIGCSSG